jgi:hypothetical protein
MIKNITELETQVRAVSLQNRARRHVIAGRYRLFGQAVESTASKPAVLGAAVLVGFCLGFSRTHQPTGYRRTGGVMARIFPLIINYLVHAARQDKQTPH